MRSSETTTALIEALIEAQASFPTIPKTKEGTVTGQGKNGPYSYKYRYADLGDVVESTRPILVKAGLAVTQFPDTDGIHDLLTTRLSHASGQWQEASMRLTESASPQAQGSALTYARRYAYCAVLGIVAEEDDDAQAAQASHGTAQSSAGRSQRQGGGHSVGVPPSRSSQTCTKPGDKDHDQYAWCQGAAPPRFDSRANQVSDGQVRRLFGIGKSHGLTPKDAVEALWPEQTIKTLDWKQAKWLAAAMEDGWAPGEPESYSTDRYDGAPYTEEPF